MAKKVRIAYTSVIDGRKYSSVLGDTIDRMFLDYKDTSVNISQDVFAACKAAHSRSASAEKITVYAGKTMICVIDVRDHLSGRSIYGAIANAMLMFDGVRNG